MFSGQNVSRRPEVRTHRIGPARNLQQTSKIFGPFAVTLKSSPPREPKSQVPTSIDAREQFPLSPQAHTQLRPWHEARRPIGGEGAEEDGQNGAEHRRRVWWAGGAGRTCAAGAGSSGGNPLTPRSKSLRVAPTHNLGILSHHGCGRGEGDEGSHN